ncbi:GNAT family N-acetyltransferase [Streptomyces sp. NPDC127106]|uniref:GNAT family N-acetyltransferase n=1 Tax=Streptomyces sp. NPDC127106 TaxID=3345360 RepID=UPI003641E6A6
MPPDPSPEVPTHRTTRLHGRGLHPESELYVSITSGRSRVPRQCPQAAANRAFRPGRRALSSGAMDTSGGQVRLRDPEPGELGWIVQRHGALYAAEYGWNTDFEALVARIVADFAEDHDPHLERVWIAELEGRPVGSVMCVREDGSPGTARLRLLLVEPEGRGHGIGSLLVDTVVEFARSAGYRELVLWTNDVLASARALYQRAGFTLVAERPHRSYGVTLTGQDWRLPLQDDSPH